MPACCGTPLPQGGLASEPAWACTQPHDSSPGVVPVPSVLVQPLSPLTGDQMWSEYQPGPGEGCAASVWGQSLEEERINHFRSRGPGSVRCRLHSGLLPKGKQKSPDLRESHQGVTMASCSWGTASQVAGLQGLEGRPQQELPPTRLFSVTPGSDWACALLLAPPTVRLGQDYTAHSTRAEGACVCGVKWWSPPGVDSPVCLQESQPI